MMEFERASRGRERRSGGRALSTAWPSRGERMGRREARSKSVATAPTETGVEVESEVAQV